MRFYMVSPNYLLCIASSVSPSLHPLLPLCAPLCGESIQAMHLVKHSRTSSMRLT